MEENIAFPRVVHEGVKTSIIKPPQFILTVVAILTDEIK